LDYWLQFPKGFTYWTLVLEGLVPGEKIFQGVKHNIFKVLTGWNFGD